MKKCCLSVAVLCAAFLLCAGPVSYFGKEAKTEESPIAVQMYTLRGIASFEAQLAAVRAAGVGVVEMGLRNFSAEVADELPSEAAKVKSLLDKYELRVAAMHVGIGGLRNDLNRVVEFSEVIGNRVLVMAWGKQWGDEAGWVAFGKELGELARQVGEAGMMLAYHNHDFEMVEFGGKTALELLFESAGSALKAEVDVAWVARGGRDPAEMLERLSGRVYSIHAKDNWPEGQGEAERGFADVGSGVLDWVTILPAAARAGVQWYIIEHDRPTDPAESIRVSAEYLKAHLPQGAVY